MASPALAASSWTTSSAERRLRGRLVAGRYRIEQLVGAGAMGYVYRAVHVELGVPCAVKVIREPAQPRGRERADAAGVLRFQIEARAVARLDHPNIVRMLDFGRDDEVDLWYLVTEHLDGQDLLDVLNTETTLPVLRTVAIARQLCAALDHAHQAGVIHRDVKPENLRVIPRRTPDGVVEHVKLLDFGTAMILSDFAGDPPQSSGAPAERAAREELERPVIGTPAYMSPEQAAGRRADARSDIYSSGVVLYEMATGRLPFERPTPIALAAAHVESPPPPPRDVHPDVDPDLGALILRCLSKDPAARPQSARALDDALADVARAARRRT